MIKKITSLFLAVTMVATMSSSGYQMAYATSNDHDLSKTKGIKTTIQKNDKKTEAAQTPEYVSGEAIVVYKSDKLPTDFTARSAKKAAKLDPSIRIENTWHFEGSDISPSKNPQKEKVNKASTLKSSNDSKGSNSSKNYEKPIGDVNIALVKSDKLSTNALIKQLGNNPAIESVEPNRIVHRLSFNDTYYGHLWGLENHGQHGGVSGISINAPKKWNQNETGKDKIVAIIDTGVDYNHPDLKNNMWKNTHYPALKGKYGYDVADNDADPMDVDGHGTHCAGIMAAQANNNIGVSGIAPDAKIMALKGFTDKGNMDTASALAAFQYISKAIDLGENVVALNLSWGTGYYQYSIDKLVTLLGQKGVVSVFASGNDSLDSSQEGAASPASFNNPYALFVNSLSEDGMPSLFSNYGKETDLFAPGSTILSTVCSPTYNPTIYTPAQQEKYSQKFNNFEDTNNQFAIPKISSLKSNLKNSKATVKIEIVDSKFIGSNSRGKSLKLTFDNMKANEFISVSCPYTRKANPNKKTGAKISAMVQTSNTLEPSDPKFTEIFIADVPKGKAPRNINEAYDNKYSLYTQIAGETHSWTHLISPEDENSNTKPQSREIVYSICAEVPGKQEIYIDDLGISNTDANPNNFGKYDFYNGTSMAAPYVTGAIALIDNELTEPSDKIDATDRINNLMTHLTKTPALENLCQTGAYLDLTQQINNNPEVTKIKANKETNTINISGFGLDQSDITVKINEEPQQIAERTPKSIVINDKGWIGTTVHVEVSTPAKILYSKNLSFQDPKKPYRYSTKFDYPLLPIDKNITTTDGTNIYYGIIKNSNIFRIDTRNGAEYFVGNINANQIMGGGSNDSTYIGEQLAYADGYLYNVVVNDFGIGMDMKLVKLNVATGKVTDLGYLPDKLSALSDYTMAACDGFIFFIGGYDNQTEKTSTQVLAYDPSNDTWFSLPSLPEGRAKGQAFRTTGDQLVYTLGYSDETKVDSDKAQPVNQIVAPKNLIFTGDEWIVSKHPAPVIRPKKINKNGIFYNSFEHCVGICAEGLVYAGAPTKNIGDTFIYDTQNDQYLPTDYQLYDDLDFTKFTGIAVNNNFYGSTMDFSVEFPINPGTVTVKTPKYLGGYIRGANKPTIPGNTVFLKPIPKKNFFTRTFTVNGQKSNLNGRKIYLESNIRATTSFGRKITSISVKRTKVYMRPGKTYKLYPKVYPTNATFKQLTYKSSNPRYITVSPTGLIKTKRNAGGRSAIITIRAKYKSTATKKIFVKVYRKRLSNYKTR